LDKNRDDIPREATQRVYERGCLTITTGTPILEAALLRYRISDSTIVRLVIHWCTTRVS